LTDYRGRSERPACTTTSNSKALRSKTCGMGFPPVEEGAVSGGDRATAPQRIQAGCTGWFAVLLLVGIGWRSGKVPGFAKIWVVRSLRQGRMSPGCRAANHFAGLRKVLQHDGQTAGYGNPRLMRRLRWRAWCAKCISGGKCPAKEQGHGLCGHSAGARGNRWRPKILRRRVSL
jgi:hypothetical protein